MESKRNNNNKTAILQDHEAVLNLLAKFLKIKVEKFTLHQRKELYQRK